MLQLRSKFLDLRPGSRIVSNTFGIEGWTPDRTETVPSPCESWCTVHLWIVPAKVNGTWRLPNGQLQLTQTFQMVSGTLTVNGMNTTVSGKLTGDRITLQAGGTEYAGRVAGDAIEGTMKGGAGQSRFRATRAN
jgi:hypothetical protein